MGLDIYLYKYENKPETDRLEKLYEEGTEKNWEGIDYSTATEEVKEKARKKDEELCASLGLSKYGEDEGRKIKIEMDSSIDKEHYFKIGYFRSSYNGGGINRILNNLNIPDLSYIFGEREEYSFRPDWEESLTRCNEVIGLLESKGGYRCQKIAPNMFTKPECNSEQQALNIFLKEKEKEQSRIKEFSSFSNREGYFYLGEPLKVIALIAGTENLLGERPCTYIVTESDNQWYITALKIVKETIEYVLRQTDINKYYLHWSG